MAVRTQHTPACITGQQVINDQVQGGAPSYRHNLNILERLGFKVGSHLVHQTALVFTSVLGLLTTCGTVPACPIQP